MLKLILHGERPMSVNKIYAGTHWTQRRNEAQRVHDVVFYELRKLWQHRKIKTPIFTEKVTIVVTAYFAHHPLDASNIPGKIYEDGLKGYVIADDTLLHVDSMMTRSRMDKQNPRVEIEIEEVTPLTGEETLLPPEKMVHTRGTQYSRPRAKSGLSQ